MVLDRTFGWHACACYFVVFGMIQILFNVINNKQWKVASVCSGRGVLVMSIGGQWQFWFVCVLGSFRVVCVCLWACSWLFVLNVWWYCLYVGAPNIWSDPWCDPNARPVHRRGEIHFSFHVLNLNDWKQGGFNTNKKPQNQYGRLGLQTNNNLPLAKQIKASKWTNKYFKINK